MKLKPVRRGVGPVRRGVGRRTKSEALAHEQYAAHVRQTVLELRSRLDFVPSSRGWCYFLEGQGLVTKDAFDAAERVINDARKSGALPLDICGEDTKRATHGLEHLDETVEAEVDAWVWRLNRAHEIYTPLSFWEPLPNYLELFVEKSDLVGLFAPICEEFHVACTNAGGWSDLNSRAAIMRRFQKWNDRGKHCVMLYCGDFDPGGLQIGVTIRKNLRDLSVAVGWEPSEANLTIERFGLNFNFIEDNRLHWIEGLKTGSSKGLDLAEPNHPQHHHKHIQEYLKKYGARKCEANALLGNINAARELCRDAILRWIPRTAVDNYNNKLAGVRRRLRRALRRRFGRL